MDNNLRCQIGISNYNEYGGYGADGGFMTIKSFFDRLMFENHTLRLKKECFCAILDYVKVYLINIAELESEVPVCKF